MEDLQFLYSHFFFYFRVAAVLVAASNVAHEMVAFLSPPRKAANFKIFLAVTAAVIVTFFRLHHIDRQDSFPLCEPSWVVLYDLLECASSSLEFLEEHNFHVMWLTIS